MQNNVIGAEEIKQWLDAQSDFSLEMKAFSHLRALNFDAEHGGTYSDPVTEKSRQFDIRCSKRNENRTIKLAVECKAISPEFPLVIQQVPRNSKESYHEIFHAYQPPKDGMGIANIWDNSKSLRTISNSPLYPIDNFVGKACNQIGRKKNQQQELFANDSEIYDKWAQSISSSYDLVTESTYEREKWGLNESFTVIFPVLVVSNECLWCVNYDSLGNRISEPENCDETDFYIGKEFWKKGQMSAGYTASHLKILTLKGFILLTQRIVSDASFLENIFPNWSLLKYKWYEKFFTS